jgi:hypothetical protein
MHWFLVTAPHASKVFDEITLEGCLTEKLSPPRHFMLNYAWSSGGKVSVGQFIFDKVSSVSLNFLNAVGHTNLMKLYTCIQWSKQFFHEYCQTFFPLTTHSFSLCDGSRCNNGHQTSVWSKEKLEW